MADKAMNEFPIATDLLYAYGENSSKEQIKVAKNNLINSILGSNRETVTSQDWDTLTNPGMYDVSNGNGNNTPRDNAYGLLVVLKGSIFIAQLFFADWAAGAYYRVKLRDSWHEWGNL